MKKTYMIPSQKIAELDMEAMIATSGGVGDGASLLNEYDADDVSYGKEDKSTLWDNLW